MSATPAICVLASGSAGNCTALRRVDGGVTLIDAGLSPRMTRQRLGDIGLSWSMVTDILLTHVDRDHFHAGWPKALVHRPDVKVHAAKRHAAQLARASACPSGLQIVPPRLDGTIATTMVGAEAFGIPLPHDEAGTIAWRVSIDGATIGHATDLGRTPDALYEHFESIDTLLLESNYDPPMQEAAPRPPFLKARITGGHGHLSNGEALATALRIAARAELQHLVLLHLSRQCNCPNLVRDLWQREAPELATRLVVTSQHQPTRWLALSTRPAPTAVELASA